MKVYGLIRNNYDGTAYVEWHRDEEAVTKLLAEDEYSLNEGTPAVVLDLPLMPDEHFKTIGIEFDDEADKTV